MNSNISDKDKKAWQNFLSSKEKLQDKESSVSKRIPSKVKSLDLHGYSLDEANSLINNFINKSYDEGVFKLIIVTGKGLHSQNEKDPYISKDLGKLKYSVPEFIENNKSLIQFIIETTDAKIEDGGSGAFYVYLKNKNKFKE